MTSIEMLTELRGDICRCGSHKRKGETFCKACYFSLPTNQAKALYKLLGDGYEQAYRDAVATLESREHNA